MNDKRQHPRYPASGTAELQSAEGTARTWGHIADLSIGGVYLMTTHPWQPGTKLDFKLCMNEMEIHGKGEVVTAHLGVGMGVHITEMSGADKIIFRALLKELHAEQAAKLESE